MSSTAIGSLLPRACLLSPACDTLDRVCLLFLLFDITGQPPVRPSPPSAEAVARAQSRTVESLEERDSTDESAAETAGEHDY